MPEVAIVGAGASGLVASIVLARRGFEVVVFEKNGKIGKKLLATGNGRCNITNKNISISNFHTQNPKFLNHTLSRFNSTACSKFFNELGIDFIEGEKGRLYPRSLQSSSVLNQLLYEAKRLGVKFEIESKIQKIVKQNSVFLLHVEGKKPLGIKSVVIATGSGAMPNLGGDESGYEFAKKFGHNIIQTHPSLVQLVTKEDLSAVAGVKQSARVKIFVDSELKQEKEGDFLFTNYGVSGSVILDISRVASRGILYKKDVELLVDLFPEFSKESLKNILKKRLKFAHQKSVALWLDGFMNFKLATYFAKKLNLKSTEKLNQKILTKMVYEFKNLKLHVEDSKGFKSAEVSSGGVDTKEINPHTLESKIVKNLYFCGEVLDVDGDCGGYNLHWAWASGFVAGNSFS